MNLDKKSIGKIRGLIAFAAFMILALIKFDILCDTLVLLFNICKPFILGGVIAFIINLPLNFYERKLFMRKSYKPGTVDKLAKIKRPVSLVLALLSVVLVLTLVVITVIPQLVATMQVLGKEVPVFADKFMVWLQGALASHPELMSQFNTFQIPEINWQELFSKVWGFLQNGMGSMLTSTITVASSIVSGTVNFFIALIFSIYILTQKEKLSDQLKRMLTAYTKPSVNEWVLKVAHLLYQNFSRFITGQCTEALILGALFIVAMSLFRFPFAFMVGVLIAFTSLIPIVGAFIGCFIGAFLILVDSPEKVIGFLILFIVIQQIEGNLIYPYVVGNSVGLPSIWVLAAVTIGGSLFGVAGMLVFIPLLSTVYMLLREDVNKKNARPKRAGTCEEPVKEPVPGPVCATVPDPVKESVSAQGNASVNEPVKSPKVQNTSKARRAKGKKK
ncbi:MAG: AI-2E family transporter [Lachnospiraceae bacterium]|nr:AI-2E family transporter [Lachnospiraceae bacterium]